MRKLRHILSIFILLAVGLPLAAHADVTASIIGGFASAAGGIGAVVVSPLMLVMLKLTAFITFLSGVVLNASIYYTVVEMANNVSSVPVIDVAWSTIRDIANMSFIFILLYEAIMTIFGQGHYQKTIRNIIVAAILINFSLFFTKIIIDVANLLALTLYHAVAPGASLTPDNFLNGGLANAITGKLGISNIWEASNGLKDVLKNFVVLGLMGSIVQLISAFTMFAVAVMLIVRYVVLIFVMILSPVFFVSEIIPGVGKYASQWKNALVGQAFFAPLYFLLMWISLEVLSGVLVTNPTAWSSTLGQDGTYSSGMISTLYNFIVAISFFIISFVVSKDLANRAGSVVSKVTGNLTGWAGGATLGMGARMGRGTLGRLGAGVASSERVKNMVEKGGTAGAAGRLAMWAGNKTAKSSFDVRGIGATGELGAGKARKGGFLEDVKNRQKGVGERAKALKARPEVLEKYKTAEKDTDAELQRRIAELSTLRASGAPLEEIESADQAVNKARSALETATQVRQNIENRPQRFAEGQATDNFGTKGAAELGRRLAAFGEKVKARGEERKGVWRWMKAGTGGTLSAVGRAASLRQEEREALAKAAEKALKEKTPKEKLAEAAAEVVKEEKEVEVKEAKPEGEGEKKDEST